MAPSSSDGPGIPDAGVAADAVISELIADVNRRYLFHNALNPFKFPEIASLEAEAVPPGLHLMLSPAHAFVVDELLVDLRAAVAAPREDGTSELRYS